ncbi:MAG: hypothetical protein HY289_13785 [Planctomycetes bacterium]|nr:hypothetical protein [Planctomycetota bacterium]
MPIAFVAIGLIGCCCFPRWQVNANRPPAPQAQNQPIINNNPVPNPPDPLIDKPKDKPIDKPKDKPKDNTPQTEPTVMAINKLGGFVKYTDDTVGKPVLEVTFSYPPRATDADVKTFLSFPQLRKLSIRETKMTGVGLGGLSSCKDLAELELPFSGATDAGLKEIATLRQLKVLKMVGADKKKVTDAGVRQLFKLEQLTELVICQNGNSLDASAFVGVGKLKQLRIVDFSNSSADDNTLKELSTLPQLRQLWFYGTRMTDAGMAHLGKVATLEEVNVGFEVTDKGVKSLIGLKQLRRVGLYNSQVTGNCLKDLASIQSLKELHLRTTAADSGLPAFRKSRPDVTITQQ